MITVAIAEDGTHVRSYAFLRGPSFQLQAIETADGRISLTVAGKPTTVPPGPELVVLREIEAIERAWTEIANAGAPPREAVFAALDRIRKVLA